MFTSNEGETTFVKWKPIEYTTSERIIAKMEKVDAKITPSQLYVPFFVFFFRNNDIRSNCHSYILTLTLGDDEAYFGKTNYTSFNLIVDVKYDDEFLYLVRVILGIGFALPIITSIPLIIMTIAIVVTKKLNARRRFNEFMKSLPKQEMFFLKH